jgi:Tfp pilus assembly protein PilP
VSEWTSLPRIMLVAIGVLGLVVQSHGESLGQLLDPTRPQGWQVSEQAQVQPRDQSVEKLKLQGTFSLAGERSAMISGKRVVVGDEVSGARVMEINRGKVVLRVGAETVELASLLPDVKSPVNSKGDME